ncbi:MAG: uridine phosphorylase, partial [Candidatus Bathyarchaeia archaeon]
DSLGLNNYHIGVTATTSDFYAGQNRPAKTKTDNMLRVLQEAGVLNFEMETATLYTLANLYGLRAGSVCAVYANRCTGEFRSGEGEENAIKVANEAVKILYEWDEKKKEKGRKWLSPSTITA